MSNLPIYEMLAQAFAREGVDTVFSLMGDGNMHWATAMSKIDGMRVFHARHEHCACGMAMGYYSATGKVGVATVTCGPGVTQIATALTTASRAGGRCWEFRTISRSSRCPGRRTMCRHHP